MKTLNISDAEINAMLDRILPEKRMLRFYDETRNFRTARAARKVKKIESLNERYETLVKKLRDNMRNCMYQTLI